MEASKGPDLGLCRDLCTLIQRNEVAVFRRHVLEVKICVERMEEREKGFVKCVFEKEKRELMKVVKLCGLLKGLVEVIGVKNLGNKKEEASIEPFLADDFYTLLKAKDDEIVDDELEDTEYLYDGHTLETLSILEQNFDEESHWHLPEDILKTLNARRLSEDTTRYLSEVKLESCKYNPFEESKILEESKALNSNKQSQLNHYAVPCKGQSPKIALMIVP
ncbi:unnamed protein product [Moneuplotes crassus]|uniref:Uncharacterized protein n=1 Tax=Euplotes crassus TaxID=5936 RepID=A0AAD2CZZ8_EUPCR|nr:unnamed protein product [Moneuplotes crassus]